MPNINSQSQVATALDTIETALRNAIDQTQLAHAIMADLSSLFNAIYKNTSEFDQNRRLASIGKYLADDWADLLDSQAEELKNI